MRTVDCSQGSPEWFAARCGKVTASRIADLMARTKTGWGAGRGNYMAELVAERLTGTVAEGFTNAAMKHGTETEPEARAAYEFFRNTAVQEVGFVLHPEIDLAGCSPDGLVSVDGMLEIKCPNTATHIETLLGGEIADKYVKQMQWQMRCCDRQWCDFVSYDPRLPERMQLFVRRVHRNNDLLATIEQEVLTFLGEVMDKEAQLRAAFPEAMAA
jgi:putative phage-type endonuclease